MTERARSPIVYLDSQDYSRFGDVLRGRGDAKTSSIFEELIERKEAGRAIFVLSMPLMSELLQFDPEHRETTVYKAKAIEALCGPYAFPTPMRVAANELASGAVAAGLLDVPLLSDMPAPNRGWFPGFGHKIVDLRASIMDATLRLIRERLPNPRLQAKAKAMLAQMDLGEKIAEIAPRLADEFQLPIEAITEALVPLFADVISSEEASNRMFSAISEPTAFVHHYFERGLEDQSLPRWMRGPGSKLAEDMKRAADEVRAIAGGNASNVEIKKVLAKLQPHFSAMAVKLAQIAAEEAQIPDEVCEQALKLPKLRLKMPSARIMQAVLSRYLLNAAAAKADIPKMEKSLSGDLMHAIYLPYVDLWRGDKRFSALLAEAIPDYEDRIVPSLASLPDLINIQS